MKKKLTTLFCAGLLAVTSLGLVGCGASREADFSIKDAYTATMDALKSGSVQMGVDLDLGAKSPVAGDMAIKLHLDAETNAGNAHAAYEVAVTTPDGKEKTKEEMYLVDGVSYSLSNGVWEKKESSKEADIFKQLEEENEGVDDAIAKLQAKIDDKDDGTSLEPREGAWVLHVELSVPEMLDAGGESLNELGSDAGINADQFKDIGGNVIVEAAFDSETKCLIEYSIGVDDTLKQAVIDMLGGMISEVDKVSISGTVSYDNKEIALPEEAKNAQETSFDAVFENDTESEPVNEETSATSIISVAGADYAIPAKEGWLSSGTGEFTYNGMNIYCSDSFLPVGTKDDDVYSDMIEYYNVPAEEMQLVDVDGKTVYVGMAPQSVIMYEQIDGIANLIQIEIFGATTNDVATLVKEIAL